ncbi:hypothetical protein [Pontibacter actiniarum]|uniref:Uncharacterized protein n=1 Tax=Pontibacter actiniarum TaxID=323450 RepID=A0A1X9YS94_9BACT|nr:hypothetical protein [Pontibacter actiniarum]ARS35755.1 hypothetical protein CA264_10050 [Pontibacter actiniarum]
MATLLTRQTDASSQQPSCNFTDPAQAQMVALQVPLEELQARCARYRTLLASLQPSQEHTMIQAANFTTDSVRQLLEQSPDSAFIRVYYGIEEDGTHRLFMAPVTEPMALSATEAADMLFVDDCCHCPPRLNCPADELLDAAD